MSEEADRAAGTLSDPDKVGGVEGPPTLDADLDRRWKQALAFGLFVGLPAGAILGLLVGWLRWGG